MDRKLGSGAYGEVWMTIDLLHKRQMACKIVKPNKSPQWQLNRVNLLNTFWREVDLLRDISHVRNEFPLLTHAHHVFSQTFCTSSVSSLRRRSCMTKLPVPCIRTNTSSAILFQTLLPEETSCRTLNGQGPRFPMRRPALSSIRS